MRFRDSESDETTAEALNFSFVVPGKLAGMAMPGAVEAAREQVALLRAQGITDLVNLTPGDYASPLIRQNFPVLDCPIADFDIPTFEQLDPVIALYRTPAVIAVHCMAGVGRTGTVLSCLVGIEHGLRDYAAISHVRKHRRASVETGSQAAFVCEFLARHHDRDG
ncbi:MAG: hypothetical protein KJO38_11280 [Gammaproteobacteria bacterium]|nr:hypothetical protein [Gammaproteobacteria bacterium]